MGVIYKRNGKTEVERGKYKGKRGNTNILIKRKKSKRLMSFGAVELNPNVI